MHGPHRDDYLNLDGLFTADELALRDRVRAFVDERIRPNIAGWYDDRDTSRASWSRRWAPSACSACT